MLVKEKHEASVTSIVDNKTKVIKIEGYKGDIFLGLSGTGIFHLRHQVHSSSMGGKQIQSEHAQRMNEL